MLPTISGQLYRTGNIDLAAGVRTIFRDVKTQYHRDVIVAGVSRVRDSSRSIEDGQSLDDPRLLPFSSRQFSGIGILNHEAKRWEADEI